MDSNVFSLADDTPQVWLEEEERGVGGGAKGAVPGGRCQEGSGQGRSGQREDAATVQETHSGDQRWIKKQ